MWDRWSTEGASSGPRLRWGHYGQVGLVRVRDKFIRRDALR